VHITIWITCPPHHPINQHRNILRAYQRKKAGGIIHESMSIESTEEYASQQPNDLQWENEGMHTPDEQQKNIRMAENEIL
jgi:hypothetical protein